MFNEGARHPARMNHQLAPSLQAGNGLKKESLAQVV